MRCHPLLAAAALLGGCTVGPNFKPPAIAGSAAGWVEPAAPGAVDARWWQALGDPVLSGLIETAITANADVRMAAARLAEARANRDSAAGQALPTLNARASANGTQLSKNGQFPIARIPGFNRRFSLFDAGFDAAWEIDLWGGTRRSIEAAGGRGAAAKARLADVRLQVIAEVARTYADWRTARARAAVLAADAGYRAELAALVQQRSRAGEASGQDMANAAARAAEAQSLLPGANADASAAAYRLAVLIGQPPEAIAARLGSVAPGVATGLPTPPAIVAAGLRSELLARRADVRAAAADLAAATADIGVATADLFPRLSLVGSLGQQSQNLSDIVSGGSTRFQIGPSFSWPVFSAGRIRAQIRAAGARADGASAAYEKAVLTALADSETAINRYAAARAAQGLRAQALAQGEIATARAAERFERGEDDRLAYDEARSALAAAKLRAVAADADRFNAYLSLAKALGGGWETAGVGGN